MLVLVHYFLLYLCMHHLHDATSRASFCNLSPNFQENFVMSLAPTTPFFIDCNIKDSSYYMAKAKDVKHQADALVMIHNMYGGKLYHYICTQIHIMLIYWWIIKLWNCTYKTKLHYLHNIHKLLAVQCNIYVQCMIIYVVFYLI